jgi:hypothetical protein
VRCCQVLRAGVHSGAKLLMLTARPFTVRANQE